MGHHHGVKHSEVIGQISISIKFVMWGILKPIGYVVAAMFGVKARAPRLSKNHPFLFQIKVFSFDLPLEIVSQGFGP